MGMGSARECLSLHFTIILQVFLAFYVKASLIYLGFLIWFSEQDHYGHEGQFFLRPILEHQLLVWTAAFLPDQNTSLTWIALRSCLYTWTLNVHISRTVFGCFKIAKFRTSVVALLEWTSFWYQQGRMTNNLHVNPTKYSCDNEELVGIVCRQMSLSPTVKGLCIAHVLNYCDFSLFMWQVVR